MLIVHDAGGLRELWAVWLTFCGFTVEEAVDCHEALEKASRVRPDAILIETGVTALKGVDTVMQLKADRRTAAVPIVVLSISGSSSDTASARAVGADAFIAGPCDPDRLPDHLCAVISGTPVTDADTAAPPRELMPREMVDGHQQDGSATKDL